MLEHAEHAVPFGPAVRPAAPTDHLFAKYYYAHPDFVDGTKAFHRLCGDTLVHGSTILEIGAGPANSTSAFLATIGRVVGLDVSNEVMTNASLASAHAYDGTTFPFESDSFAACASNYVLEHIDDPARHFMEVARVLKPDGVYCFRTPNVWHYVGFVSKCLPHTLHLALANRLRGLPDARDPYPTFYRSNTRAAIGRLARSAGLSVVALPTTEAEPWYGRSHALLFYPMMLYERFVNSSARFEGLRSNILGVLQKPAA